MTRAKTSNSHPKPSEPPPLRGAVLTAFFSRQREIIISGPAGTGKSRGLLEKWHYLCQRIKGLRVLFLRKVREDMNESLLATFENDVLGEGHYLLTGARRESRKIYHYSNGSEIIVAGFTQNTKNNRAKVMSTDYDAIYVQEATELTAEEWEKLTTRLRHNRLPYQQLSGDCNPDSPLHWIWSRQLSGKVQFLNSRHEDNPKLHDGTTWTREGIEYRAVLSQLTGHTKDRLYGGKWVQASGLVLDTFEDTESVTPEADYVPGAGGVMWAIDDGYSAGSAPGSRGLDPNTDMFVADSHPRVILLVQAKPDGHLDVFAEDYRCLTLSDAHIEAVKADSRIAGWPNPDFASHGHGTAEIRGRLYAADIYPRQNTGTVEETVKLTRTALGADANGWRRIRIHPRCKHLRAELLTWAYDPTSGKPHKFSDHGPEALRGLMFVMRNM